tara:strand:- start:80 stop:250 length:171 start_codon:yes stop_codon:yes gene_type:complete
LQKNSTLAGQIKLLKYYITGSAAVIITCFFLYLLVEQDPPEGEVIIEVNTDDKSKN